MKLMAVQVTLSEVYIYVNMDVGNDCYQNFHLR